MRDLIDIGSDEPNLADVGRPRLVSVCDRDGNVIIDRTCSFGLARRYDSHRVAARLMAKCPCGWYGSRSEIVMSLPIEDRPSMPTCPWCGSDIKLPMATRIPPRPRGPMATPDLPPTRYDVEDFDSLAPFRGIVIAAIVAAFGLFVAALYFVR